MARKLSKKAIDREIDRLYRAHAEGRQIDVMKIGAVFRAGHAAWRAGEDPTEYRAGKVSP